MVAPLDRSPHKEPHKTRQGKGVLHNPALAECKNIQVQGSTHKKALTMVLGRLKTAILGSGQHNQALHQVYFVSKSVPCKLHACCNFKVLCKVLETATPAKSRGAKHYYAVPNTNNQRKEDKKTIWSILLVPPVVPTCHHVS